MSAEPRIIPVGGEPSPLLTPDELTARKARQNATAGTEAKRTPERRQTRDRFAVLNAFADYGARLVDTTAQACWWIVYRETKPDGLARVSQGRIAECVGRSRWTVLRALGRLETAGLLTIVRRGGLRGGASTYRVHGTPKRVAPAPHTCVASTPHRV